jgi:acid phosphatase type 7
VRGPGNCRIAFWHRPRYNAGTVHGDAPDVEPLWAALRGRARIVLSGHEHNMQRFAARDGITQFISGAGGRDHYGVHERAGLAFADTEHFGALRLTLRPGRAMWAFVAAEGTTLDSGSIGCKAG